MLDLSIINGTLVTPSGSSLMDIGIADGRTAILAATGFLPDATETIDATGLYVLPGAIDSHYHCRAPSHPERETFASGTQAAANGGVTTVIEMPISIPPTTDGASLALRQAQATDQLYIDMAFYASSGTLDRDRIQSGLAEGAVAFKAFLQALPPGREEEFEGICIHRHDEILRALELVAETGRPAVFHAEDYATYTLIEQRLQESGAIDPPVHAHSRPAYVEAISVSTLLLMAEATGAHLHVPHVSSALAVDLIRAAKARGVRVTAETCPQYLALTKDALASHGPYAKCNPPLKTTADNDALWAGLRDGTIDTIATDHSPYSTDDKDPGWENIWHALPGFPGVDILVPFVMSAALDGRLPVERAIEVITSAPADIFGLSPRKGRIVPGADADLVLYNPAGASTVDPRTWKTKATAIGRVWDGHPLNGHIERTIVRGETVLLNGDIVATAGCGNVIRGKVPNLVMS